MIGRLIRWVADRVSCDNGSGESERTRQVIAWLRDQEDASRRESDRLRGLLTGNPLEDATIGRPPSRHRHPRRSRP